MNAMVWITGGLLTATGAMVFAQGPQRITPEQVRQHLGETVTICGTVTVGRCENESTLLDLATVVQGDRVSIAVPNAARGALGGHIESRYQARDVCATGTAARVGSDFHVVIRAPEALTIQREPAAGAIPDYSGAFTTCDEGVVLPRIMRQVKPQYTPQAMRDRVMGRVLVQGVVAVDGSVQNARIVEALEEGLDRQALNAFNLWRFAPGTLNGQAVPVLIVCELTFTLK